MAKLTPQQIADKQVRNATNAVQDYRNGVNAVTVNPMDKAIASIQKMRNNFNAAVDSGKVQAGMASVGINAWKAAASKKGGDNYAGGITAAAGKILAFQTQIAPFRAQLQATIATMPTDTLDQRLQKMVANAKGMSTFRFAKPQTS
jgi:hypothetical protein